MDSLLQEMRQAIRVALKNPGFTATAAIVLALGIGANSAIFSIADALLLRPLPFSNLERLVTIRETFPNEGLDAIGVSPGDFADWRAQNDSFQQTAAYRIKDTIITGTSEPESVGSTQVSADFFRAIEVTPIIGRTFSLDEDLPGRDQVAIIGYGLWQRRFGGDSNIVGSAITVNGRATVVIGVMRPSFDFPFGTEMWTPLALTPQEMHQRDRRNLLVLARLKNGVSVSQAQGELSGLASKIAEQYPQTNTRLNVEVLPIRDDQAQLTRPLMGVLFVMSGVLLLLACANVTNLILARATTRQREIAIRSALGATRWRVVRQMLAESLLLSSLAGALGLMLAFWGTDLIKASLPADVARFVAGWKEIRIDGRALGFTLFVGLLTTLLSGLAPAWQTSRPDVNDALKEGGKATSEGGAGHRLRSAFVVSELCLSLVLLVGAGLMLKGFSRVLAEVPGFEPDKVLTLHTALPDSKYGSSQRIAAFYQMAIERMKELPGVQSVGTASNTPLNNKPNPIVEFIVEGRPPLPPGQRQSCDLVTISPNYFKTVGVALHSGRDFSDGDGKDAPGVAIISELMARRYWQGEDPIGGRIRFDSGDAAKWVTIVGIVSDTRQSWFDREIRPQVYLPYLQRPEAEMHFLLRTSGDPMKLAVAARNQIYTVDPQQLISDTKTLARLFSDEGSPFRFAAELLLVFGVTALALAAFGVYGIMSYSVVSRTREIGIRMALGAQRGDVLRLVVGQGTRTALLGLGIGLPVSFVLSRVMAKLLFGIVGLEPLVLASLALLLAAVALVSSYLPAYRATKVDAIVALRYE